MNYDNFLEAIIIVSENHMINLGRFIYDAYFYAEEYLPMSVLKTLERELHYGRVPDDQCIQDYILDILAGRCKPMTNKPVLRMKA